MEIYGIKAYEDNYIWWIEGDKERILVDPGEPGPVLKVLRGREDKETKILLTHSHQDHVGGVPDLKKALARVRVYGPEETAAYADEIVKEGGRIQALDQEISILSCPGHTRGHLVYQLGSHLFVGDVLFMAGCGRVFTGDYRGQYQSLKKLKNLADETLVYPGHEYSLSNLVFAQGLFPENQDIQEALTRVRSQRKRGEGTLPTSISLEKKINPFFLARTLEEFIDYRKLKDRS